jgi:hypothetical protein
MLAVLARLVEADELHPKYLPLATLDDFLAALALWDACAEVRLLDPLLPRLQT